MKKIVVLALVAILFASTVAYALPFGYTFREQNKEKLGELGDAIQRHKDSIRKLKDAFNSYKGNRSEASLQALLWAGRDAMLTLVERVLARIEVMKARIDATEALTDGQKDDFKGDLDELANWFMDIKGDIEEADTKEEQKEIHAQIVDKRKELALTARKIACIIISNNIELVESKFDNVTALVKSPINELEVAGEDVSELEALYEELQDSLNSALEKAKEAANTCSQIDEWEGSQDLYLEAKGEVLDARQDIIKARQILRDIIQEIKNLRKG